MTNIIQEMVLALHDLLAKMAAIVDEDGGILCKGPCIFLNVHRD